MSKWGKRVLSALLVCVLVGGALPLGVVPVIAATQSGDDGVTNWNFIKPVTHLMAAPAGYTEIRTAQQLSNIRSNHSGGHILGNYILMNDIDLSGWGDWEPIGTSPNQFRGAFDGNGYIIKNLTITGGNDRGLFGSADYATIKNVGMENTRIDGDNVAAAIIGGGSYSSVDNCYNTGNISAVVGAYGIACSVANNIEVNNCYNTGNITSEHRAGGIGGSSITNCYNTGSISVLSSSNAFAGGIMSEGFDINNCYNTGKVSAISTSTSYSDYVYVGGISGDSNIANNFIAISNCYNTGDISASTNAASAHAGGIHGRLRGTGSTNNLYNTGVVTATSSKSYVNIGGICGTYINGSLGNSYCLDLYDSDKGIQRTSNEMKKKASFTGFDFDTIWDIVEDNGYPFLRSLQGGAENNSTKIEFECLNYSIPINGAKVINAFITPVDFQVDNFTMTCFCSDPDAIAIQETYTKLDNGNYTAYLTLTAKKLGNYTITLATKDGSCMAVCNVEIKKEEYPAFDFEKDTWNFRNFREKPLPISEPDLEALTYGLSPEEKGKFQKRVELGALPGHCAGMSITSILAKVNRLNLNNMQPGATYLRAVNKNDKSKSVISYYALTQFLEPYINSKKEFCSLSTHQQLRQIEELAEAANLGGNPFVLAFGADWGHAVTAYGLERGEFKIGGILWWGGDTYDTRVLIYDNDSTSWNDNRCLYFNKGTDQWTIPYYEDAYILRMAFSDINLMNANSLEMNKKKVVSSIEIYGNTDVSIKTSTINATVNQIVANLISGVVAWPDDGAEGTAAINVYFDNSEQPFIIQPNQAGEPLDVSVLYDNYYMSAEATATSVEFNPAGIVGIDGNADDFNLSLTGDYNGLPWHTISASGDNVDNPILSKSNNGYLLAGIKSGSITVSGKNDNEIRKISFTTDKDTVFIGESGGELAVYVDVDNNGDYETLLAQSQNGVTGITFNNTSLSMNYKANASLTATVTPEDATNKTVTWKSDNEKVATVDQNGNVKAVGRGKANLTATTEDGQKTATCEVTVKYAWWQWLIIIFLFGWIWY